MSNKTENEQKQALHTLEEVQKQSAKKYMQEIEYKRQSVQKQRQCIYKS